MKILKQKAPVLLLYLLACCSFIHSESGRIILKIPVRIIHQEASNHTVIQKQDFSLYINDQQVPIEDFRSRKVSLSEKSSRGRHFFLSFQICDLDKTLTSTLSHFLTGILNPNDSLHVISPDKIHVIPVSGNKGAMLNNISQIIKKECLPFNLIRQVHEKKIENEIQHLHRILNDSRQQTVPQLSLNRFIENLSHLFSTYKNEFLSLDMLRYQDLPELFVKLKGNHWWFHLQQNRTLDFINPLNRLIQSLRQYRYYPLLKIIAQIQNHIKPSKLYPFDQVREMMVENRIRFHALLTDDIAGSQAGISVRLQKICHYSGGIYLKVLSPSTAIEKIGAHVDSFFEMTCHISAGTEAKQVRIVSGPGRHQLIYKHRFSPQEITQLQTSQAESKLAVSNISILKNKITFWLSEYKINTSKGFGLIKIRLDLTTTGDRIIYSTENILRASRDRTRISVPFPICSEPVLNLTIIANDLLDNHSLQARYQVFLHEHVPLILPQKNFE